MQTKRLPYIALAAIVMLLPFPNSVNAGHTDTEISTTLAELTGTWSSEGYGHVLEIQPGAPQRYDLFELTSISCMRVASGMLQDLQNAYVHVLRNADSTRFTVMSSGSVTTYAYNRLGVLPPLCANGGTGFSSDALFNFDVLWTTFNEQYAFFEQRGVDWIALRDQLRPQLNPSSTDEDLVNVFIDLVTPLCDGHVEVQAPFAGYNLATVEACSFALLQDLFEQFGLQDEYTDLQEYFFQVFVPSVLQIIESNYIQGMLAKAANDKIMWGDLGGGIGYLNVMQMSNLAGPGSGAPANLAVLASALDQAIASLADKDVLVFDIRLNTGGFDHVALDIISRFSAHEQIGFTKKARWGDSFTATQAHVTSPVQDAQFLKPVIILTTGLTASASENLLLGLHSLPQVTLVGETTMGVHSDKLDRVLPNGWAFSLSNEVFTDAHGTVFEGRGFTPDVEIASLRSTDIAAGRDAGIEAALELVAFPSIYPGLTGTWWNPSRSGEGYTFDFFELGGTRYLFVTFYTYDANGNQAYLVGVTTELTNPVIFNLGITQGGTFGPVYDSESQSETPWGALTVDFQSCTQATVTLTPSVEGFEGYSTNVERLGDNPFTGGNCY